MTNWIEADKNLSKKRETLRVVEITGCTVDNAVARMLRFWSWVDDNVGSDAVVGLSFDTLAFEFGGDAQFWESLLDDGVQWLARNSAQQLVIPKWRDRFGKGAKVRKQAAKRQSRKRWRDKGLDSKKNVTVSRVTSRTRERDCHDATRPDPTRPDPTLEELNTGPVTGRGSGVFKAVTEAVLRSDDQLLAWTRQAGKSLSHLNSEAGELRVFGAAERALDHGDNPSALFTHIVGKQKWELITQDQEDSARKRLKTAKRQSQAASNAAEIEKFNSNRAQPIEPEPPPVEPPKPVAKPAPAKPDIAPPPDGYAAELKRLSAERAAQREAKKQEAAP